MVCADGELVPGTFACRPAACSAPKGISQATGDASERRRVPKGSFVPERRTPRGTGSEKSQNEKPQRVRHVGEQPLRSEACATSGDAGRCSPGSGPALPKSPSFGRVRAPEFRSRLPWQSAELGPNVAWFRPNLARTRRKRGPSRAKSAKWCPQSDTWNRARSIWPGIDWDDSGRELRETGQMCGDFDRDWPEIPQNAPAWAQWGAVSTHVGHCMPDHPQQRNAD